MFLKVLKMWKSENQNSKLPRKENSVSIVMNLASDWSIESLFEIYSFKNASTHSYLGFPGIQERANTMKWFILEYH